MYNNNQDDSKIEKVYFTCSIKNSKKNYYYKILILNEEKSLGKFSSLETEELLCNEDNSTIKFKQQLKDIEFSFSERQLYIIEIQKRKANSSNKESTKRMTVMASLVSSPNSIYERQLNQKDENSEIFSIKLNINMEENLYISEFNYNQSIVDFFQNNGKLKLNFLFDFSHKSKDNNYSNSINIFYNFLVDIYNLCHFYTINDEINMYGTGVQIKFGSSVSKLNIEESNTSSNNFEKIKESFLNVFNNKYDEKELNICSFLENCMKDVQNNFFNVLFIFLRYLPEDINNVINKIREIRNKNLLFSIIIIGVGDKFPDVKSLISQIRDFSNTKFIQIKDYSLNGLKDEVRCCLNHLCNNIIELKKYIKNVRKNSDNNSINEENFNNISEEEKENMDEEKSDDSEQKEEEINNPYSNYKKDKEKKLLQTSSNAVTNSDYNPYSKSESHFSQSINNKDNKSQNKVLDSASKTDYNSNNNEISPSNNSN
jgi:hypothetical protein